MPHRFRTDWEAMHQWLHLTVRCQREGVWGPQFPKHIFVQKQCSTRSAVGSNKMHQSNPSMRSIILTCPAMSGDVFTVAKTRRWATPVDQSANADLDCLICHVIMQLFEHHTKGLTGTNGMERREDKQLSKASSKSAKK